MESKRWFKPVQGRVLLKKDAYKSAAVKSEDGLINCLYLDTADTALQKNGAVLMIAESGGEFRQTAVFEAADDGKEAEYTAILPENGVDLSLFPKPVCEKLCGILNGKPLQICYVTVFEEKKRLFEREGLPVCTAVSLLGRYENEKGEIRTLAVQNDDGTGTASLLTDESGLEPCESPYIQAMRFRSEGCNPAADRKRMMKAPPSALAGVIVARLFEMVKAYAALETGGFTNQNILKLRVAARRLTAVVEAFSDVFGEKAERHKAFLKTLTDDTDDLRSAGLLSDELDAMTALYSDFDFSPLREYVTEKRETLLAAFNKAYRNGAYAGGLAELWADLLKKMHEGLGNEAIIKATEKIREWTIELNMYKKSDFAGAGTMHDYRKKLRRLRYGLECLSDVSAKRLSKAIKSCGRMQDEFGMAADTASYIKTLQRIAAEENRSELSLLCGVCCGVYAESLPDIQNEAVSVWKEYRNDLKALEDTL